MSSIWERFDNIATADEVREEQKKVFTPLDEGVYRVILTAMKAGETQGGSPQMQSEFQLKDGGRKIWYNESLEVPNYPSLTAKNIAHVVTFIGDILGKPFDFESVSKLGGIIDSVPLNGEYEVEVSYAKKDIDTKKYPKLKVVKVVTGGGAFMDIPDDVSDEGLPFC